MTRWHAFQQLILARVREFFREPEAIFWVYGFPIILAVGLGLAFSGSQATAPEVDVVQDDYGRAEEVVKILVAAEITAEVHPEPICKDRLAKGKTSLYLVRADDKVRYVYDPARPESQLARRWVDAALARASSSLPPAEDTLVSEPGSRYIHFLMPGLIGMNIMGGGLFGVGFILVDMRVRKLFKRLMATPMHRGDFLLSLLTARLLFLLPEMAALLLVGWLFFTVPLHGSFLTLLLVIVLGALAFSGLGLLLASRTDKTETMSGYMNVVMLPMYLLSGVFFSSKRFPDALQPFIQALPLTQLNDALREVMLEGAGLIEIGWRLAILAAWASVCFTLALRWFRWR
jgi:ABC-2 type transport system permease protein